MLKHDIPFWVRSIQPLHSAVYEKHVSAIRMIAILSHIKGSLSSLVRVSAPRNGAVTPRGARCTQHIPSDPKLSLDFFFFFY
jgi:hypothetical protein